MIEVFTNARIFGSRGAAITVVLRCDSCEWRRGFLCGKFTTNQLELKALEYALKSITDKAKSDKIIVYSINRYVVMMLEKKDGKWSKGVEKNILLIERIRQQFERFPNIDIIYHPDHARLNDIRNRTEKMVYEKNEFFEKA